MSRSLRDTDVSPRESWHLAVASSTFGPWRAAAAVGALAGGVSLALRMVGGHFGLGLLIGPFSVALMLFFLVGGAGTVIGSGPGADRRIRRWARAHPWRVAAVPAALLFVADVLVRQFLTTESLLGSVWDGVWRAVVVAAAVGATGMVSARKTV